MPPFIGQFRWPIQPVLAVKIRRTGALNCSLDQRQDSFCAWLRTRKERQRGAWHSILFQKVPLLILANQGDMHYWFKIDFALAHYANDILTSFSKRMPDLFQRKSIPLCVTSLRQVQYFLAALKRAVHNGDQETTPMTALKRQITPKANPVPLPIILCLFNIFINCPPTRPRDGH